MTGLNRFAGHRILVTGAARGTGAAVALRPFGGLDVLVNSAAHCTPDLPLFEDQPDDAWDLDLDCDRSAQWAGPTGEAGHTRR